MTRDDEGADSPGNEPPAKAILPEPRSVKKQFPISSVSVSVQFAIKIWTKIGRNGCPKSFVDLVGGRVVGIASVKSLFRLFEVFQPPENGEGTLNGHSGARRRENGRRMLIENEQTREVLRRIVRHITKDAALQEDLMQQALVHLWRQEGRCPGQTPSWYVQSCRFHLNNFIRLGRSVDSTKRHPTWQGNEALSAVERDPVDESEASGAVLAWVSARDMVAQLSKWLTPIEKQILTCLADGLSLREIGGRLKISHTAVIKRRRNIAALAFKLGINPLPSRLKDREG